MYFRLLLAADYGHLIEIYDFPPQLQTCDLLAAFIEFKWVGLVIRPVSRWHSSWQHFIRHIDHVAYVLCCCFCWTISTVHYVIKYQIQTYYNKLSSNSVKYFHDNIIHMIILFGFLHSTGPRYRTVCQLHCVTVFCHGTLYIVGRMLKTYLFECWPAPSNAVYKCPDLHTELSFDFIEITKFCNSFT